MRLAIAQCAYGGDDLFQPAPAVERSFDNVASRSRRGRAGAGSTAPQARVETPRVPMGELWVVDDRSGTGGASRGWPWARIGTRC